MDECEGKKALAAHYYCCERHKGTLFYVASRQHARLLAARPLLNVDKSDFDSFEPSTSTSTTKARDCVQGNSVFYSGEKRIAMIVESKIPGTYVRNNRTAPTTNIAPGNLELYT